MKSLYFVTTNDSKFHFFSSCFNLEGWDLLQKRMETPEIQAYSTESIAVKSAEFASKELNAPVAKEDIGLFIESLGGFPGPLLNQIENWLTIKDFERLLSSTDKHPAYWQYSIALAIPNQTTKVFTTKHHGFMTNNVRGKSGYTSDKLFIPLNENKTIAELLDTGRYQKESSHYLLLQEYLSKLQD